MAVDASKLRRGIRRLGEPPTDSNPELSERPAPQPAPPNLAEPTPSAGGGAAPIPSPRGGPTMLAPEPMELRSAQPRSTPSGGACRRIWRSQVS